MGRLLNSINLVLTLSPWVLTMGSQQICIHLYTHTQKPTSFPSSLSVCLSHTVTNMWVIYDFIFRECVVQTLMWYLPLFCFPTESKEVYKRQVLSITSIAMAISLLGTLCMALYCRNKWEDENTQKHTDKHTKPQFICFKWNVLILRT